MSILRATGIRFGNNTELNSVYGIIPDDKSSAQITHYYNEENLKGKQVIAVCNFPEKNIAGVVSQVLVLGAIDAEGKVTLLHPSQKAENGLPIA